MAAAADPRHRPRRGTTSLVAAADGTDLLVRRWRVPEGVRRRGSALLVHGIGEHSGRYAAVAAELGALGLEVRSYDHRGHGASGGARGVVPSGDALLDDLRLVFDALAADGFAEADPQAPLLLGHSMGGALAAQAATGGWVVPSGLVLSSPGLRLRVSPLQALAGAVALRVAPGLAVPSGLPAEALSHDPDEVARYRADSDCHDRITGRLLAVIAAAGEAARRDAPWLLTPTLQLVAGDDRLVDPEGARELHEALPPGVGTLRWYDGLFHELFNEREEDRRRVFADLRAWVDDLLAAR